MEEERSGAGFGLERERSDAGFGLEQERRGGDFEMEEERYPTIYLRVQDGGSGRRRWRGGGVGIAEEKARHGGA